MDPLKVDPLKMPEMVMCGDHQSFAKNELNAKVEKPDDKLEKDKPKDRIPMSYARISPTSSRTDRSMVEAKSHAVSEHALRLMEARRHARSLEVVSRQEDLSAPANRALVQAALGSFRWPPYLVAIWVLVLLLTHVLHCLVTMLERALPALKKFCSYFRTWTEESWRGDIDVNNRLCPLALAACTGVLYAMYFGLYAVYMIALWSIEPLCTEDDKRDDVETKVTNYDEEITSKMTS